MASKQEDSEPGTTKSMEGNEHKCKSDSKIWLKECWVGYLRDLSMYEKIDEVNFFGSLGEAKLRHMGGGMVLI